MTYVSPRFRLLVLGVLLFLCALALPLAAYAETVLRVGDSVSVTADQSVPDDFYAAGGIVTVSGAIGGDMYATAGSVTVNGEVASDLSVLAGTVQVHSPVADDVRIVGGDVTIAEYIKGDLFVIAGSLTVLSSAKIDGNLFFYGGQAVIDGAVVGSIMGTGEHIRIDAPVGGSVEVTSSRPLALGERASVKGDVSYTSFGEMVRAQNAVIEGEIVKNEPAGDDAGPHIGAAVVAFFVHLFALLCLYFVFRRYVEAFAHRANGTIARSGLVGLGVMLVVPLATVVLLVTFLGLFLGLMLLFTFAALLVLSFVLSGAAAGMLLAQAVTKRAELSLAWLVAGTLALHVGLLVPVVGFFLVFAATAVSLGSIVYRAYQVTR